ncbi:DUF2147 domain-containing protein [Devosia nitrariae]|uniref:DUF2147 domain-containing protein n=1 Tax=Devosia nitrariae TaxID=2071872 RepID=A0ABQ5W4R9_9HYPH|nr:DUF2147 domain-containing protein [Devosia nitrariae]GLQ55052.1 hypothetical protein GCM10010862_23110 [Devosia nitrariae]
MTIGRQAAALAAATFLLLAPAVQAQDISPLGTWQSTKGDARFTVDYCPDGGELCATLTWLREDVRNPARLASVGTHVVEGARKTGPNRWRGTLHYAGHTLAGSVTLVSPDFMRVSGCMLLIFCETVELERM